MVEDTDCGGRFTLRFRALAFPFLLPLRIRLGLNGGIDDVLAHMVDVVEDALDGGQRRLWRAADDVGASPEERIDHGPRGFVVVRPDVRLLVHHQARHGLAARAELDARFARMNREMGALDLLDDAVSEGPPGFGLNSQRCGKVLLVGGEREIIRVARVCAAVLLRERCEANVEEMREQFGNDRGAGASLGQCFLMAGDLRDQRRGLFTQ